MKNTTQTAVPAAIDPAMVAAIIAAMQSAPAAAPANTMALAVSQTVGNADAVQLAQDNARRAVSLLDEVSAETTDTNQIIGKGLSVCCANGTLQAYKTEFISNLSSDKFTHLTGSYRAQLKSYITFICDFGAPLADHLIIPAGRVGKGTYYSLQKLYKNLKKLGKPEGDSLPHWLTVNMQVLDELNGTLALISKDRAFDKAPLLAIRSGIVQTRDTLAELVETNRPRTEAEKAAIAASKEAARIEAAKVKEAAKAAKAAKAATK